MPQKQRKQVEKALEMVQEILWNEQDKISNMEANNMEHLPLYDEIYEDVSSLEDVESLMEEIINK